jgi:hypothetical protein
LRCGEKGAFETGRGCRCREEIAGGGGANKGCLARAMTPHSRAGLPPATAVERRSCAGRALARDSPNSSTTTSRSPISWLRPPALPEGNYIGPQIIGDIGKRRFGGLDTDVASFHHSISSGSPCAPVRRTRKAETAIRRPADPPQRRNLEVSHRVKTRGRGLVGECPRHPQKPRQAARAQHHPQVRVLRPGGRHPPFSTRPDLTNGQFL